MANEATLRNDTLVTLPSRQSARMPISPAGASRVISVTGSTMGRIPVSSNAVTTQIVLLPDIGGYSLCSMMMKPASASGLFDGTIALQHNPG